MLGGRVPQGDKKLKDLEGLSLLGECFWEQGGGKGCWGGGGVCGDRVLGRAACRAGRARWFVGSGGGAGWLSGMCDGTLVREGSVYWSSVSGSRNWEVSVCWVSV